MNQHDILLQYLLLTSTPTYLQSHINHKKVACMKYIYKWSLQEVSLGTAARVSLVPADYSACRVMVNVTAAGEEMRSLYLTRVTFLLFFPLLSLLEIHVVGSLLWLLDDDFVGSFSRCADWRGLVKDLK